MTEQKDPRVVTLAQAMYLQQPHTCDERMLNCAAAILDALAAAGWQLWPHGTAFVDTTTRDAATIDRLRRIEEAAREVIDGNYPPTDLPGDMARWNALRAELKEENR